MSNEYSKTTSRNYTFKGDRKMQKNYKLLESIILNEDYIELQICYNGVEGNFQEELGDIVKKQIELTDNDSIRFTFLNKNYEPICFECNKDSNIMMSSPEEDILYFEIYNLDQTLGVSVLQ